MARDTDKPTDNSADDRETRVKEDIRQLGSNLLNSNNIFFTFLRSIVSSQAGAWVDMGTGFVLFAWAHFSAFLSTAAGCVAGGIVNCILCYRFTFHATGCSPKAVAVKYAMVWAGSLLLNSKGTDLLYNVLSSWTWLEHLGFKPDGYFMAARLAVSLIVSWGWNFLLQRYFVYRPKGFDRYAIAAVNFLGGSFLRKKQ